MSTSSKTLTVVAALIVACAVAFLTVRMKQKPAEPVVPAVTEPQAPAATETPEPAPEPAAASTVAELKTPELPLPDTPTGSLLEVPKESVPPEDSEAGKFFKAMQTKLGMDKVKTLKMKMAAEMSMATPQGPMTITSNYDFSMEMPKKFYNIFEVNAGGRTMRMYQVTDGVFMEMGQISADGKKSPMQMRNAGMSDNQMSLMTGGAFDPGSFASGEVKSVTVDPSDPLFQKEDGSPIENLDLSVLTFSNAGFDVEMYVDPKTMEMRAMKMLKDGAAAMQISGLKYEDVGEGVRYPMSYDISMNPAALGAGQGAPQDMKMKLKVSDVKINPELDPSIFSFTPNLQPSQ